jgi:hypothetical protein
MPTFPRATQAKPRLISMPKFPDGFASYGGSGKGQFRAFGNMGRTWEEVYPVLDTKLPAVRALLTAINQGLREKVIWDVQHLYLLTRLGAGGGSPLVNGASQVGSNLIIDAATPSVTNWLRRGDLISVVGCAVVFDVNGDVSTNGSGQATIPIHPPIFSGGSPADNAVVEINPANIFFKAVLSMTSDFPHIDAGPRLMDAGLTLQWREQPA